MKKICVLLAILSILLLTGCSETVVKYQCVDGSFVDNTAGCTSATCPATECPKLDCSVCPAKIETRTETRTVTERVYICPDEVTEVSDKEDCKTHFLSDAEYALGDEIIAGDFKWTFNSYTTESEIGEYYMDTFMGVKADGEFLIIDTEVENIGKSAQYLMTNYVKIIDDQEREFSADATAAIYIKPSGSSFGFDNINPGIVKRGKLVFDVPSGLRIAKIRVISNQASDRFFNIKLLG
jgi:hypothetical protein